MQYPRHHSRLFSAAFIARKPWRWWLALVLGGSLAAVALAQRPDSVLKAKDLSGNPVIEGWYADPEAAVFDHEYWIYPTYSDDFGVPDRSTTFSERQLELRKNTISSGYLMQTFFNAFSSKDLVTWTKHPHVLDVKNVAWAAYAVWAPAIFRANGKYYLFFGASDIQNDHQTGGIGVAVADNPAGPFVDALGHPLIDKFQHGAQPIDQFVFRDDDGQIYLYYGGWKHCNVARLSADLLSVVPFADGESFKEITPESYVEGPLIFKRKGQYYLMWSEGGWGGPDYSVAYAIGSSAVGPFKRMGKILQQDTEIATGAGHHSIINIPGTDEWMIVYHRRPLGEKAAGHRETAIDHLYFNSDGTIKPVKMTREGVERRLIP